MFVDRVQVELHAGKGGDGCVSFRREKFVPRGGPDGGNGGHGGSIIVVAQDGVNNLSELAHRKRWKAPGGQHGEGYTRHGKKAEDLILRVPPGTVLIDAERNFIIRDLIQDGDQVIAARGGKGGWGNTHYKSATNRAPREHTRGEEGELRNIIFELKVIADVGLVGKPNAGKSTLLSRVSHARPEIADYPFTTKHPNLGLVRVDIDRTFVMADIPGLIEGAHTGIGLGHEFLRHIERAGILVHLVEPAPMDGSDPIANYQAIREELVLHNENLGERPEILVVTKAELPDSAEVMDRFRDELGRYPLLISAVTGLGLNELTRHIVHLLDEAKQQTPV